ncbi:unnamed protein product [Arctogadus glacialis]
MNLIIKQILQAPTLQCGEDTMKLQALGLGASQFQLHRENRGPLPLSEIPPTCRYSMQRNALGLVMVAPYDGCNIIKEGGCYVLPMRWQGMPMMLVCPQPTPAAVIATPTTTAPAATTPTTPSTTPAALPFQFYQWNPLLMPPFNNNPNGQPVVYPPPYRNP